MKISEILKNKSTISFEVFPPKNKEGNISSIYSTIEGLAKLSPDFISVTYGAGGSTKGKTVEIASVIKHEYGIESVAHLSCISSTKEDIKYECERLKEAGIDNILALRGDYPADATNFDPENLEFHYASELNEFKRGRSRDFRKEIKIYCTYCSSADRRRSTGIHREDKKTILGCKA